LTKGRARREGHVDKFVDNVVDETTSSARRPLLACRRKTALARGAGKPERFDFPGLVLVSGGEEGVRID
jgi:hypothetical protein